MATDETLLHFCGRGESSPTLRFYTWSPRAISIGYFQDPCKEIDLELCRSLSIPVVRRLTGGGAVVHSTNEITYSFAAARNGPFEGSLISDSYRKINQCLQQGMNSSGIDARLCSDRSERDKSSKEKDPLCFLNPSRHDITLQGKKVAGSAQRRTREGFLQHGSILLGPVEEELYRVFKDHAGSTGNIPSRYTWIGENGAGAVDPLRLQQGIREGFEKVFNVALVEGELSDKEERYKDRLLNEKYLRDEWNICGRTVA